jgi:hypothetical protein
MDGDGAAVLREVSLSPWSVLLGGAAAVLLLWLAAQVLEWAWWAPRRMNRALRAQGLRGTQYRLLWGDLMEDQRLIAAAKTRPVSVDRPHDILPRVAPLLHHAIQEHGNDNDPSWMSVSFIAVSLSISACLFRQFST